MLKTEVDFSLIYEERIGDILFLLGTILAIISNYQAEQSLINKQLKINSTQDYSAYTIATASLLFLVASILFSYVAIIRLMELRSTTNSKVLPLMLKGSKFTAIGNVFKVIGFGLAAIGYQLKANSQ